MNLQQWAERWNVPPQAFAELAACSMLDPDTADSSRSEGYVQSTIRLEAAHAQPPCFLWRNNVGAGKLSNGKFMRWGLANDSKKLNDVMKSGDLIGIRCITITPPMVGLRFGQFVSRECKRGDWKWCGDEREVAQLSWSTLINSLGGDAQIVKATGSL